MPGGTSGMRGGGEAMRTEYGGVVFPAGLFLAAFVSLPVVNLATPLLRYEIGDRNAQRCGKAAKR